MRRALLALGVVGVAWIALAVATHASARPYCAPGTCAGATVVSGANVYAVGGRGSCQTVGGDLSVSGAGEGEYFRLLWTRKDHGNYRSVVWHASRRLEGVVLGATITVGKDADGRTSGTFSGIDTHGVRTTGSFSCG